VTRARLVRYGLMTAIVASLLLVAMRPSPRRVDTATLVKGTVVSTIEAEGRTRVRDRYVIAAPIAAQARRLELQPGDAVARGDVVAMLDPLSPAALDPRSLSEAQSRAAAAESRRQAASEELRSAQALASQATADAERLVALAARGLLSADQAERAETDRLRALRDVAGARFRLATAAHERDAAQAALAFGSDADADHAALELRAPVDGVVLRRHIESSISVQPGTPLLEIGDVHALEVEVDVLSADAVQLRPGMPVELLRWGDPMPLDGVVHRVEPAAFTRVSALGVEEQRVWSSSSSAARPNSGNRSAMPIASMHASCSTAATTHCACRRARCSAQATAGQCSASRMAGRVRSPSMSACGAGCGWRCWTDSRTATRWSCIRTGSSGMVTGCSCADSCLATNDFRHPRSMTDDT